MDTHPELYDIASRLLERGKGLLAADESTGTMNKRLDVIGAEKDAETRRIYRQLLFTAPGIEEYISGVILYDSSIRNRTDDGVPFADLLSSRGIIPGIKVDEHAVEFTNFPGEKVTQGLDNLDKRFAEYYDLGARFAKWRAVIAIDDGIPTEQCLKINAVMLARYAALAQDAGIVPILEPEVLMHGGHDIKRAEEVTTQTLSILYDTLKEYRIDLKGTILKSSMVLAGDTHPQQSTPSEVADATLRTFAASVPPEVLGIVFLSGGQSPLRATENLQEIAMRDKQPWAITFSYSRAIEEPVLAVWKGDSANTEKAQRALLHRARMNGMAQMGKYTRTLEEQN